MSLRFTAIQATAVIGIVFMFLACSTTPNEAPRKNYPEFIASRPRSILVMPPINKSLDVRGPLTFLATSVYPLAESGYYVIPVSLSTETFKRNGVTVAEDAHEISFSRLHEIFGADAALYITISSFGTRFVLIDSITEAAASAILVDLRSGQRLWSGETYLKESSKNRSTNSVSGSSFSDFAISLLEATLEAAIDQVINTSSNKAHNLGKTANYKMLNSDNQSSILYGPYHPMYGTD